MNFRLFTVEEANQAIPELSATIRQMNRRRQDLIYLLVELEGLRSQAGQYRSDAEVERRIEAKVAEVNSLRRQLQEMHGTVGESGCVVRDYDRGLVDFPAIIEGQPGYLCWHSGEERIAFWHGPEDGFAGRKPLVEA